MDRHSISNPILNNIFIVIKERYSLTAKEDDVIKLLTFQGLSNRDLGALLNTTEKTMKNHIAKILVKTRNHSCRELQALIFREIIVPVLTKVFQISENKPEVRREYATVSYEQTSQVG